MNEVRITVHAYDRLYERLGWDRREVRAQASLAWERGLEKHDLTEAEALEYVDTLHGSPRFYNGVCFVFENGALVTAWVLPEHVARVI